MDRLRRTLLSLDYLSLGPEERTTVMRQFVTCADVLALLESTASAPLNELARLARTSYYHVNGFEKLVLSADNDLDPHIRFHYWPSPTNNTHIHDHSWDFTSLVLLGELEIQDFALSGQSGNYTLYAIPNLASSRHGNTHNAIQYHASPDLMATRVLKPRDAYALKAGCFHCVRTRRAATLTFIVQSNHVRSFSRVALPENSNLHDPYSVARLSVGQYVDRVQAIMVQLMDSAVG